MDAPYNSQISTPPKNYYEIVIITSRKLKRVRYTIREIYAVK